MITDGSRVYYRGGNTEYVAVCTRRGWDEYKYTITSVKSGRNKFNVPERDLTLVSERIPVKSVKTTKGRVRRPNNWKTLNSFAGGARRTWIGEKWVFKKGHGGLGEERCMVEACRYFLQSNGTSADAVRAAEAKFGAGIVSEAQEYHDVPVAECYLLEDGTLMMERVLPVRSLQRGSGAPSMNEEERIKYGFYGGNGYPDWTYKIDSAQVGITDKGELVAYDL